MEGVAAVLVSGGLEEEIHVELDERRIANLGLSASQIVSRLAAENVNLTGGRCKMARRSTLSAPSTSSSDPRTCGTS